MFILVIHFGISILINQLILSLKESNLCLANIYQVINEQTLTWTTCLEVLSVGIFSD